MVDETRREMNQLDWQILAHDIETGKLPMRRIQVPLPPSIDDVFRLCHDLSGLVMEIQSSARVGATARHVLLDIDFLIQQLNSKWQHDREKWERELQNQPEEESKGEGHREQIRAVP